MNETPKGLRRHIAILGRRNAGKSTLLNAISGQTVSIVSPEPGTTTDPVEKTMELMPLGPVVLLDTAGMDDVGELGEMRVARSLDIIKRSDAAIIVSPDGVWELPERDIANQLREWRIPFVVIRNKFPATGTLQEITVWKRNAGLAETVPVMDIQVKNGVRQRELAGLLQMELGICADAPLANDLLPPNGLALLVVPLDTGAPKGRLILPQVQTIRDLLDGDKISMVVSENNLKGALEKLARQPDLVICDSQVIRQVAEQTPKDIPLTTFSILMARFKGDLAGFAAGARALTKLVPGDKVLIQEACSHHPQADDIGRIKIPRLLNGLAGGELDFRWSTGKELTNYRDNFKAIIHCGACVITRTQMLARMADANTRDIPITNYGMTISLAQGVLERVLSPFPDALEAFQSAKQ